MSKVKCKFYKKQFLSKYCELFKQPCYGKHCNFIKEFTRLNDLEQQLQACKEELQAYKEDRFCQGGCTVYQFDKIKQLKEENEKLKEQNKLFKGTIKKFNLDWYAERLISLTKQNKQMRKLISEINSEYSDDGILSKSTKYAIQQSLKGVE